jgi:hypothetical protein
VLKGKNYIHGKIKSRVNSGIACNHAVQNLVFPSDIQNVRIKIYKTVILHVASMGVELVLRYGGKKVY